MLNIFNFFNLIFLKPLHFVHPLVWFIYLFYYFTTNIYLLLFIWDLYISPMIYFFNLNYFICKKISNTAYTHSVYNINRYIVYVQPLLADFIEINNK